MAAVKMYVNPTSGELVIRIEGLLCPHGVTLVPQDVTIPYKQWIDAADRIRFGEPENRPKPQSPDQSEPVDEKAEGYPVDRRERRSV